MRYETRFEFRYRILSLQRKWCSAKSQEARIKLDNNIQRLYYIREKVQNRLHRLNEKNHQVFMKKYGTLPFHKELSEYQIYNIRKLQIGSINETNNNNRLL